MTRRRTLLILGATGALLVSVPAGWSAYTALRFPSDRSPQGAYLRIALAIGDGRLRDCFPYLETEAQHALYTIREYRQKALALVRASYPEPERSRWTMAFRDEGEAREPADVWVVLAVSRGWDARLRQDLSGIQAAEVAGERATIVTVRGTRYAFRRAENGIWGLTLFTAQLVEHKQLTTRDFAMVERAASDYERAGSRKGL